MTKAKINERAKRAAEFSPGWSERSEAEPWVTTLIDIAARFSGRQIYGTARGSERANKLIHLPARYRERFCTAGSLSCSFVISTQFPLHLFLSSGFLREATNRV